MPTSASEAARFAITVAPTEGEARTWTETVEATVKALPALAAPADLAVNLETLDWNRATTSEIQGVTTIREAFERYAKDYGIEVITDAKEASKADVVLLCVGEQPYAEWNGDTEDLSLTGTLGLPENRDAMNAAEKLGKPIVTCIVAGRHVILKEDDYKKWDSVVMCYLPGSEGKGISDVLCGCADFSGKLPSPWYGSIDQIGTDKCFLKMGYGMTYGDGFTVRTEPETVLDETK